MKIIAIDFDDTLFEYVPPPPRIDDYSGRPDSIGEPIWENIGRAVGERMNGNKLILWTCREGKALDLAVAACHRVGLDFDAVNANVPEMLSPLWPDCRKIKADEYWDDKAVRM